MDVTLTISSKWEQNEIKTIKKGFWVECEEKKKLHLNKSPAFLYELIGLKQKVDVKPSIASNCITFSYLFMFLNSPSRQWKWKHDLNSTISANNSKYKL